MSDLRCPECGATWTDDVTCETYFHEMLFWEQADLEHLGMVHHLMVLSFHMQHPSRYSSEALAWGKTALADFLERGVTPQQVRLRDRASLDSGARKHKIKGTPESHGAYAHPVAWTMSAGDVVAGGTESYVENVRAWAQSIYDALTAAGELSDA
jgi:hypothetical protein